VDALRCLREANMKHLSSDDLFARVLLIKGHQKERAEGYQVAIVVSRVMRFGGTLDQTAPLLITTPAIAASA